MRLTVHRAERMFDAFTPPADKSLSHRSLLFGAIANGPSVVRGLLPSEDVNATLGCLRAFGVEFRQLGTELQIVPPSAWHQPDHDLDCGNSGTTTRLISGLIAGRPIAATLTGDPSLSKRPMGRIALPLAAMGAEVSADRLPMTIRGRSQLRSIQHLSPTASAQVKSCILLAGLSAEGASSVVEPSMSRDHTERMLRACGVEIQSEPLEGGAHRATVRPTDRISPFSFDVPGDISSAAFFLCAALLLGGTVTARSMGINPTRTGLLDVFSQVGAKIDLGQPHEKLGEPTADVTVSAAAPMKPFTIEGALVPRLIDEIPVLAVLATQLNGVSKVRDAGELRVKESDRIARIAEGIRAMGGKIETSDDGFEIEGPTPLRGCLIDADRDHRIGMAFAVAGLVADGDTIIEGAETIATSYPDFEKELSRLQ